MNINFHKNSKFDSPANTKIFICNIISNSYKTVSKFLPVRHLVSGENQLDPSATVSHTILSPSANLMTTFPFIYI